jgi:hypothetical protein
MPMAPTSVAAPSHFRRSHIEPIRARRSVHRVTPYSGRTSRKIALV